MKKRGVSLITLIITIIVLIILSGAIILTLNNTGVINSTKEAKFKADLKNYDEEIRLSISSDYIHDDEVINKIITKKEDLKKYCQGLTESEHIEYAYISDGVLTLRGNKITDTQRKWAEEAKIKIDDGEEIVVSNSDIITKLSETDWTKNDVTLTIEGLKDESIVLHETPYSFDNGQTWVKSNSKVYVENTTGINIKVRDEYEYVYINPEININNIDKTSPTTPGDIGIIAGLNTLKVMARGSVDNESGLAGYKYSLSKSGPWTTEIIPENSLYTFDRIEPNTSATVYAKAVDKVGNESISVKEVSTSTLKPSSNITIKLSKDDWTMGPISANISCDNIPENYVVQYKLGKDTQYINGSIIPEIKENTTIYARLYYKDIDSKIAATEKAVSNIDTIAPTITNVSGNPTTWTKNNVTLTINGAKDTQSGLNASAYSFDNGVTWQASNTNTYITNTSNIIIKVRDKVGNIYTHSAINITKIDNTAPSIINVTGNPSEWTKDDVTLIINGATDNSGILAERAYSFDGGVSWQAENKKTYTENTSNIIIKVKDAAGNIYIHGAINITKIDKTAPSMPTAIAITPSLNKITAKASGSTDSGSGVAGYKYRLGENGAWSDLVEADTNYTFAEEIKANTTVKVYAKAVDNLGFESSVFGPVDATTSTVTNKVSISLSTEEWTTGPITATLSYDSVPTGYVIQYKIGTGNWTDGTKTTNISSNTTVYGRLYNKTLDDEIATNSKDITNIDKYPPTDPTDIEVVTREQTSIIVKASGSTDVGIGLAGYQYSIDGTNWSSTIASETNYTISSLSVNTTYTVYARAIDKLDNISEDNYSIDTSTLTSYSISYDKNTTDTVTNMPDVQQKIEGKSLILSDLLPERSGYKFIGWAISLEGQVEYQPGNEYTLNSNLTLYAQWKVLGPITPDMIIKNPDQYIGKIVIYEGYSENTNNITWRIFNVTEEGIIQLIANDYVNLSYKGTSPATNISVNGYSIRSLYTREVLVNYLTDQSKWREYSIPRKITATGTPTVGEFCSSYKLKYPDEYFVAKYINEGDTYGNESIATDEGYVVKLNTQSDNGYGRVVVHGKYDDLYMKLETNYGSNEIYAMWLASFCAEKYYMPYFSTMTLSNQTQGFWYYGYYNYENCGVRPLVSLIDAYIVEKPDGKLVVEWDDDLVTSTLTFNANGGSVNPSSIEDIPGYDITLPIPTRSGYMFEGWYTAASGGTKVTYTKMPETSQTLYAHWKAYKTYTIQFNSNGGSGVIPGTITKQGTDANVVMGDISSAVPTRGGYTFAGWSTYTSYNSSYPRIAYSGVDGATTTSGSWTYAQYCNYTGGSSSSTTLTLYALWKKNVVHTMQMVQGTQSGVSECLQHSYGNFKEYKYQSVQYRCNQCGYTTWSSGSTCGCLWAPSCPNG